MLLYHGQALAANPFDTVSIRFPHQTPEALLAQPTRPGDGGPSGEEEAVATTGGGGVWGREEVRACVEALQQYPASEHEKNKRFKLVAKAVTAASAKAGNSSSFGRFTVASDHAVLDRFCALNSLTR